MGRSTAEDVLQIFLDQSKILQVALDGLNLLFLKNLDDSWEEKELLPLLDLVDDVDFTVSIVLKQGWIKEVIGNFKTVKGYVDVSPGSSNI